MPHLLVRLLRFLFWSEPDPPLDKLWEGHLYRFRAWPDDGILYRLEGTRLVNLDAHGDDLLILDDGQLTTPAGAHVGHATDLVHEPFG